MNSPCSIRNLTSAEPLQDPSLGNDAFGLVPTNALAEGPAAMATVLFTAIIP